MVVDQNNFKLGDRSGPHGFDQVDNSFPLVEAGNYSGDFH
jgi:hypothetical protein